MNKTAMQELIEWVEERFSNPHQTEVFKKANELLEKEKEQINILINALERIRDWDDEMHSEWDDCGDFARFTLQTYKLEI